VMCVFTLTITCRFLVAFGYLSDAYDGRALFVPIGLSMVSKLSPVRLASLMMGVWMLSSFFANITAGFIASFFVSLGAMSIFAVIPVTSILLGLFLLAVSKWLTGKMHGVK
ncbi:MAG: hypothetical protein V8R52_05200, partial [Coprobacter fastidiosus]